MSIGNFLLSLAGTQCPGCHKPLQFANPEQIALKREAKCANCGYLLNQASLSGAQTLQSIDKSVAVPTKQVKISDNGSEFRVDIRWLSKSSWFIIRFAILWNLIIGFMDFMMFSNSGSNANPHFQEKAVLIIFSFVGVWLLWQAISQLLNTTTIVIKNSQISASTKPMSFAKPWSFPTDQVMNISLERTESGQQNNQRVFSTYLNLHLKNGNQFRLSQVQDVAEGIYVEKLLEAKLQIKDDPSLDRIVV